MWDLLELSGNGKKSIRCHQCGVEFEIDMSVLKTLIHGAKTIIEADEKRTLGEFSGRKGDAVSALSILRS